jgi:histidinol phosphatase-like enzyme
METNPKTIFCMIDGVVIEDTGDYYFNTVHRLNPLPGVLNQFKYWCQNGYTIILFTSRKESTRSYTEKQLYDLGIQYNHLIMNLPIGDTVLINTLKQNRNSAYAVNKVKNSGLAVMRDTASQETANPSP